MSSLETRSRFHSTFHRFIFYKGSKLLLQNCSLCLQERQLQQSHILPKFVVAWLKDNVPGAIRKGDKPNRRIQDSDKLHLLCSNCEEILSKFETNFAEKVFNPWNMNALAHGPISYGPWALKCLISISWRVLLFHSRTQGLPNLRTEKVKKECEHALERWRLFILDRVSSPDPYIQHLLPMEILQSHTLSNLSPFMNRYIVSTLDHDVIGSNDSAYAYSKLGSLLLFGTILEPGSHEWDGTQVAVDGGDIRIKKYCIPARIWGFINDRSNLVAQLHSQISLRQQEKVESSMLKNINKLASSKLGKAIEADVQFGCEKAFDITKKRDDD